MSGKGSSPRPFSVTNEEYANRWNAIFGRDKEGCQHKVWAVHSDSTPGNTIYVCMECDLKTDKPSEVS